MENIEGIESTKPHKTWFIERGDGFIFATREDEAWNLLKNRTNWMRADFKIIGVSDGTTYHKILREGKQKLPEIQKEVVEIQTEITEYTATEKDLKYKELAEENDERLLKIKAIKKNLTDKLTQKLKEIEEINTKLEKKAFEAELEVARGNIEMPDNNDVIAPAGDKDIILKNLPR